VCDLVTIGKSIAQLVGGQIPEHTDPPHLL
jgi:hypothetical protein